VSIKPAAAQASSVTDQLTVERLKAMVEDLQIKRAALHPETEE
jgi:hypothetical protein